MMRMNNPPPDLTPQAVKVARRLDALPRGRAYNILLVKRDDEWVLIVKDDGKTEVVRA
jgi:hypothetical protein